MKSGSLIVENKRTKSYKDINYMYNEKILIICFLLAFIPAILCIFYIVERAREKLNN